MRGKIFTLSVVVLILACLTVPAQAARVDVASRFGGAIVASATVLYGPPGFPGVFNLTVSSEARFDGVGVYTYFYAISGNTGVDPIESFNVFGDWATSTGLSWGIVTGETAGAVSLDPVPGDISFGTTMTANFSDAAGGTGGGLHAGESITIYVQSIAPPVLKASFAIDDGSTEGAAYAPTPEPATLLLLGSGLLGGAGLLRKRLKFRK